MKAALLFAVTASLCACTAEEKPKTAMETVPTPPPQPAAKVEKTDEEWRKLLTPEQYRILRQAGSERPNGPVYKQFKEQAEGTYYCAGCNAELFTSKEKFDSHCGLASFRVPSEAKHFIAPDDSSGDVGRTEGSAVTCDAPLGPSLPAQGSSASTARP